MSNLIPENLRLRLRAKRLIFTVTTGRSGTGYLAKMLRCVPDVGSYHEPEPRFSDVMRLVQQDANVAYQFWVEKKLPHIANEPAPIYIETSHLFCKGFAEPLLELGFSPDLIILTRSHRQVATSLYQLGHIPGRTDAGLDWYIGPEDPGVLPLPDWQSLHDYQLCYWYCLEIERRAQQYVRQFQNRGLRVARVSLDNVGKIKGFHKLTKELDLPRLGISSWIRFLSYRGKQVNRKTVAKERKAVAPIPENILDSLELELSNIHPTSTA